MLQVSLGRRRSLSEGARALDMPTRTSELAVRGPNKAPCSSSSHSTRSHSREEHELNPHSKR